MGEMEAHWEGGTILTFPHPFILPPLLPLCHTPFPTMEECLEGGREEAGVSGGAVGWDGSVHASMLHSLLFLHTFYYYIWLAFLAHPQWWWVVDVCIVALPLHTRICPQLCFVALLSLSSGGRHVSGDGRIVSLCIIACLALLYFALFVKNFLHAPALLYVFLW